MAKKKNASPGSTDVWKKCGGTPELFQLLTDSERELVMDITGNLSGHTVKVIGRIGASFENLSFKEACIVMDHVKLAVIEIAVQRAKDRLAHRKKG